jgi:hypothetical protein
VTPLRGVRQCLILLLQHLLCIAHTGRCSRQITFTLNKLLDANSGSTRYVTCSPLGLVVSAYQNILSPHTTHKVQSSYPKTVFQLSYCLILNFFIIIHQDIGHSRPVPVQNFKVCTYEFVWTLGRTPCTEDQPNAYRTT